MTSNKFFEHQSRDHGRSVQRIVRWMTGAAWTTLLTGLGLSLFNLHHFSEQNAELMVGIGFMIGSVHIYVIRTAIHLVHARASRMRVHPD